ncbi:roadblock/LC7 domain-containing protein [Stenotrophomonas sp. SAM-B]|uniref:roadblock/LC7 domain-containing protein n=1 Tax=Stenotrophomonas sp. SAM-B TaxID=2729141 RepID=UPI001F51567E|nr:roadblock/LC7 domain-containing protein [Stenotrophomonas sp. SAM-B]
MRNPPNPLLEQHLNSLVAAVDGLSGVVVASLDGFALAQVGRADGAAERLAAMTSSMLGLANALGRDLDIGVLDTLMLDAEHGKVLMLTIPSQPMRVLMAACNQDCVMGQILWHAKQTVPAIAIAMDTPPNS